MEDRKTFLGWDFRFNEHIISLTDEKFNKYMKELAAMGTAGSTNKKQIESVVGKINVIGYVLPATRHFTARLRRRIQKCANGDNELDEEELKDITL